MVWCNIWSVVAPAAVLSAAPRHRASVLLPAFPSAPPDPAAAALQHSLTNAIASGLPSVTIEGGNYNFGDSNLNIFGARGLAILAPDRVILWFGPSSGVNITNSEDISLGNWTIDSGHHNGDAERREFERIARVEEGGPVDRSTEAIVTLNLLNCTRVSISDVSIHRGDNMILTAFNGGGAHKLTRVKFEPTLRGQTRDAIHFSDQRVGPTIVDSVIGHTGDDFFNIHTTLMVVVRCEERACVMVNPHMEGPQMMNTIYHTNCVLHDLVPGDDQMSFYSWPTASFATTRYPGASLTVARRERVTDEALLAEALSLVPEISETALVHNPVSLNGSRSMPFEAWDVWRVEFAELVPSGVGRTALVQIDTMSNAGAVLRNNTFVSTSSNIGRFKSSHSVIEGNTFSHASIKNLELSWLPQFFEGPVILSNVTVANNNIEGEGAVPIHCGPFCGAQTCLYSEGDAPSGTWNRAGCTLCPDCSEGDTPWTTAIRLINNTIV